MKRDFRSPPATSNQAKGSLDQPRSSADPRGSHPAGLVRGGRDPAGLHGLRRLPADVRAGTGHGRQPCSSGRPAASPTEAAVVMTRHAAKVLTDIEALMAAASRTQDAPARNCGWASSPAWPPTSCRGSCRTRRGRSSGSTCGSPSRNRPRPSRACAPAANSMWPWCIRWASPASRGPTRSTGNGSVTTISGWCCPPAGASGRSQSGR